MCTFITSFSFLELRRSGEVTEVTDMIKSSEPRGVAEEGIDEEMEDVEAH